MPQKPIALEDYEALADRYAKLIEIKPHNAYYERPATLSLLPNVINKRILDAGCGPGKYTEILCDKGAKVVAFDISPKMVAYAKQRVGERAEIFCADLTEPFKFAGDGSFDGVLAPICLDYIEDWVGTFKEFYRILKPHGFFIFSINHPFVDYQKNKSINYFALEAISEKWTGFGKPFIIIHKFRRSMGYVISTIVNTNFIIDQFLEPIPTQEFARVLPKDYEEIKHRPGFLCIRCRKE